MTTEEALGKMEEIGYSVDEERRELDDGFNRISWSSMDLIKVEVLVDVIEDKSTAFFEGEEFECIAVLVREGWFMQ